MLVVHWWESYEKELSDLCAAKKYTVLYFYPKDNTPGCTIESKNFQSLQESFDSLDTQIIWVSKDWVKSHCGFADRFGLLFPLVADTDLVLHKNFSTIWEKKMFGKTYMWTIRSTFLLDSEWKIINERRKVSVRNHAEEVLAFVTAL
jgi:peroxiredoxin Q/BCP